MARSTTICSSMALNAVKAAAGLLLAGAGLLLASQKAAAVIQNKGSVSALWVEPEIRYSDVFSDIRGLRNNNPGNIERNHIGWNGMSQDQSADSRFIVFESPEWGIRALGRVLVNYQKLYGINTVRGLINRWAPTHENDTDSYVNAVASSVGVQADQVITVKDHLLPLSKAIIHHENGIQPYSDALLNQGLALV